MAIIKDFSKIAGSSFVNFLIGLFSTPLITRMVYPEQYGNWALFCVYSNVLSTILLLGTDYIIVRYYYKFNDEVYRYRLISWCFKISILAIVFTSIPMVLSLKFIRPNWSWIILGLFSLNVFMNVLNRLSNLLLRFENKINILSIATILHKAIFITIALALLLCVNHHKFELLSISTVLSTGATVIVCLYYIRYLFHPKIVHDVCLLPKKEMFSYGLPLMFSGCAYILFQTTDKLVISNYCSETDLGIYTSAASFLSLFAILQSAFTTVWWPYVMKNYEKSPENKTLYIKANDIVCYVLVIIGLTFILFKDLIILFLGENFRGAIVVLPFIVFQPILYTLSETVVVGLNFQKKSKAQLFITISSLVFNIIINVILTKAMGIIGTSIAVGLSYIFFLILRTAVSYYYYKVQYHFIRMFLSVVILFSYAFINTLFPNHYFTYIFVVIFYLLLSLMYKDVIKELLIKILELKDKKKLAH